MSIEDCENCLDRVRRRPEFECIWFALLDLRSRGGGREMPGPLAFAIFSPSMFTRGGKISSSMLGVASKDILGKRLDFALRGVRANAMVESAWRPEERAEH